MPTAKKIIDFKMECSACKEWKYLDEFNNQKGKSTGKNSSCKVCVRKRNSNRHEILPDSDPRIINGKRICNICNQEKFLTEFGQDKESMWGRSYKCKTCKVHKESRRQGKYLYGITFEEKQKMLVDQMGLCANRACSKEIKFDTSIRKEMAAVDHNHETGKIRGLLCIRCNLILGFVEHKMAQASGLSKAMFLGLTEYLQKHT